LTLVCLFETGSHYVSQLAWNSRSSYLRLLSAGITGMYHHAQLQVMGLQMGISYIPSPSLPFLLFPNAGICWE
jgi:hypothetical protein